MDTRPGNAKATVVLVDDSSDLRAVVARSLESSGLFEVVAEAGDGDEAFRQVHLHRPALLLIDVSMPTVDGLEALPSITALCPETTVVVLTGFEEPGLVALAGELGAADVVDKSIDLRELPQRLMRTLVRVAAGAAKEPGPRLRLVDGSPGATPPALSPEQEVLNEHVQQFRQLFDQAAIGMATLTVAGTVVRANPALARLMSCEPDDLVGVDYGRLTLGAGDRLDRGLASISASGAELTTFEHRLPARPGDRPDRLVRVTLAPIRESSGQVLYVFAQVQDITAQRTMEGDLRRSEENFRLLVTAVEEYAIFMLDVKGNVVSWNAGAQRIKGYAADEIVGRSFRVFYPEPEQASGHPERNLQVALRTGGFAEEGWRVRKDGSRFWASVVISPVFDDAGTHIGFAKVTRDQTKQREHEEERKNAVLQQTQLLAVTAHELRTPMAVIDGSASALQASWNDIPVQQRDELVAGIRTSAHRLRRLVSDLTMASRVSARTLQLRRDDLSLSETLRLAVARSHAVDPGADVTWEVPREAVVHADEGRLGQALDNLLDNALRHGTSPVVVTGAVGHDTVHIRVTDAGPGVPSAVVPRLFDRLASAGRSRGTGLGLFLVREIARRHGGEATYHPPGAGRPTAFELTLPWQNPGARRAPRPVG
ncbi:MAG: PAS domain S-box protein [Nocardioidaceae bacterium]|nr:PAS domain S-box protein [Nocardioidaceae bacterium]NUS53062.1 PAS domain S-box protein [Nocardioidaceae bacterium]